MWNLNLEIPNVFGGRFEPQGRFEREYHCYSVSFKGKSDMEKGNKILLPQSALSRLAQLQITWPMLFEVTNPANSRFTHSGVLEFISEEGTCNMPYWMMQNLLLKEGDIVRIRNTSLPKGTFVKLQPLAKDFMSISNPKAVLENALRNYATLTVGDNIVIQYLDKTYDIEVVELKPSSACTIIETDVEVEFKYPEEYFEKDEVSLPSDPSVLASEEADQSSTSYDSTRENFLYSGTGRRLDGKQARTPTGGSGSNSHGTKGGEFDDDTPWKKRLPQGVRIFCEEYSRLLNDGRIPGYIGKVKIVDNRDNFFPSNQPKVGTFKGKGFSLEEDPIPR